MILVTAAGGKTGRQLVRRLAGTGEPVRALGRSERIHALRGPGVETVAVDLMDTGALRGALEGVRAVVHIGPTMHPLETAMGQSVIDTAWAQGVGRFVLLSVHQPQIDALVNHQAKVRLEDYVVASGLDYTILQPMRVMQNYDPVAISAAGTFGLPFRMTRPLGVVDLADVADVAAQVLNQDGHVYATYSLCGAERLSGEDIAETVARATGSRVRAEQLSMAEYLRVVSPDGPLPRHSVDGFHRLFSYYDRNGFNGNANVLRWLLGREPGTFRQYVDRCLAAAVHAPSV